MKKKLWAIFIIILFVALGAEYYMYPHSKFEIANMRFFNVVFGFSVSIALIIVAKILGILLKRKTNYYKEARDDE